MIKSNSAFFLYFLMITSLLYGCSDDDSGPLLEMEDQVFTIAENAQPGDTVGTLQASGTGESALAFSIVSGNDQGVFALSSAGVLSIASVETLDYEATSSYELEVEVNDAETSSSALVSISITDVDEEGQVIINGIAYEFSGGYILDEGASTPLADDDDFNVEETHYKYHLTLLQGTIVNDEDGTPDVSEVSFLLAAELLAPGTEEFTPGTFEYMSVLTATQDDIEGRHFFTSFAFVIDGNDNGTVLESEDDLEQDTVYLATDGTVEMSTTGESSYSLDFDVTVSKINFSEDTDILESDIVPGTEQRLRFSYEGELLLVSDDDSEPVEGD